MARHVQLPECVAHRRIQELHAPLPSKPLFLLTAERATEEVERRILEWLIQERCVSGDDLRRKPRLPRVERPLGHERRETLEERRLPDDPLRLFVELLRPRPSDPVETRHLLHELCDRIPVEGLHRVTALDPRPLHCGPGLSRALPRASRPPRDPAAPPA